MQRTAVTGTFILFALIVGALLGRWQTPLIPEPAMEPPGGDFTLKSADGPVSLKNLRGKVVLLYFGYAGCPDICPTSLTAMGQGLKTLKPDELARVTGVFVSVDPQRDTPATLKTYAAFFHPNILGATGTKPELDDIIARYGGAYRKQEVKSAVGYVIDHTSFITVIGRDGRIVERLPYGTAPNAVADAVRRQLRS
jgi:protein SCO1